MERERERPDDARRVRCARELQALLDTEHLERYLCASNDADAAHAGCKALERSALAYRGRGECLGNASPGRAFEIFAFMCRNGLRRGTEVEDIKNERFPGCKSSMAMVRELDGREQQQLGKYLRCGLIHLGERGCRVALHDRISHLADSLHCGTVMGFLATRRITASSLRDLGERDLGPRDWPHPSLVDVVPARDLAAFARCIDQDHVQ